jgi:hypothetical protein
MIRCNESVSQRSTKMALLWSPNPFYIITRVLSMSGAVRKTTSASLSLNMDFIIFISLQCAQIIILIIILHKNSRWQLIKKLQA